MRGCEIGPSVVSSLQRCQCAIQASQLRKLKPSACNTIPEHASSKQGEEAKLLSLLPPGRWCCLTRCYSEGDTDLCLLFPSFLLWLFIVYTLWQGEGNTLQICCCCWTPATEHLSISVIMQNAGQLVFVYILRGRECPHPSGQIRCNFRERKSLGSTVLAKTHEVCEREGIPKWWQGRPSVV